MPDITLPFNSRFTATSVFSEKENTFFGLWKRFFIPDSDSYRELVLEDKHIGALDLLAFDEYGDENLWWVIADFNQIVDPFFGIKAGDVIKIPNKSVVDSMFV